MLKAIEEDMVKCNYSEDTCETYREDVFFSNLVPRSQVHLDAETLVFAAVGLFWKK